MGQIVNKLLLAVDTFLPEFTYIACGPFAKNKERIQNFKEIRDSSYIYRNELGKACFPDDMAYGDFVDLAEKQ